MAFNEKARGNLKDLYESKGSRMVEMTLIEGIEKKVISPDELSLRELWDAFTDYAPLMTVPKKKGYVDLGFTFYPEVGCWGRTKREAIGTGSFEKITGALINAKMIEGYDTTKVIWPNFVTVVPSKLRKETVTGITSQVMPLVVPEGKDYSGSGVEEKYVTIQNFKFGRIVEVTEEMIYFDQTGQVLNRAKGIGKMLALYKEKNIIEGVQDINANVWNPSDSALALYSNAVAASAHLGDNLQANNPFGAAGLAAIEALAHNMTDDSIEQNYITVMLEGMPALFPVGLMEEAWELSKAPTHPETAERAPNYWMGKFVPWTSPYVTNQSETTWYWGDFKESFWWCEVWPMQTMDARPGDYKQFEADIKSRHKVREFGGVGCLDYTKIFKSTA